MDGGDTIVNLAAQSVWVGGFSSGPEGQFTVTGGAGALFINNGSSGLGTRTNGTFDVPIVGKGSISAYSGTMEFGGVVGPGQTIENSGGRGTGLVVVDKPYEYLANTELGDLGEVVLAGLKANSFSFQNDMLTLWSGDRAIYDMRLQYYSGLEVVQAPTGIAVYSGQGLPPMAGALPLHAATS